MPVPGAKEVSMRMWGVSVSWEPSDSYINHILKSGVPREAVAIRLLPSARSWSPQRRYDSVLSSMIEEMPSSDAV